MAVVEACNGPDLATVQAPETRSPLTGWLQKRKNDAAKSRLLKSSNRRFFTLDYQTQIFFYSHNEGKKTVSMPTHFRHLTSVEPFAATDKETGEDEAEEDAGPTRTPSKGSVSSKGSLLRMPKIPAFSGFSKRTEQHGFIVRSHGKPLELLCDSKAEADIWIAAIQDAIELGLYSSSKDAGASEEALKAELSTSPGSSPDGTPRCDSSDAGGSRQPTPPLPEPAATATTANAGLLAEMRPERPALTGAPDPTDESTQQRGRSKCKRVSEPPTEAQEDTMLGSAADAEAATAPPLLEPLPVDTAKVLAEANAAFANAAEGNTQEGLLPPREPAQSSSNTPATETKEATAALFMPSPRSTPADGKGGTKVVKAAKAGETSSRTPEPVSFSGCSSPRRDAPPLQVPLLLPPRSARSTCSGEKNDDRQWTGRRGNVTAVVNDPQNDAAFTCWGGAGQSQKIQEATLTAKYSDKGTGLSMKDRLAQMEFSDDEDSFDEALGPRRPVVKAEARHLDERAAPLAEPVVVERCERFVAPDSDSDS